MCIPSCAKLREFVPKNHRRVPNVHFRVACVAQKRRCLNSLISSAELLSLKRPNEGVRVTGRGFSVRRQLRKTGSYSMSSFGV